MKKIVLFLFVFVSLMFVGSGATLALPDAPLVWEAAQFEPPTVYVYQGTGDVTSAPVLATDAFWQTAVSTANITVNYLGDWPVEAEAAFEYATTIWEASLVSSQPIEVDAQFATLPAGALGGARAGDYYSFSSGNGIFLNTFYPVAVVNALVDDDANGEDAEILASFSNDPSLWYYGTDGNPPNDKFDFVSVVLHEIGHGLGFAGSMSVNSSGIGSYGAGSGVPFVFEQFSENGAGQKLIDSFPNNSAALAAQLTGGDLYFDSPRVRAANGGQPARLYAPGTWQQGSSYSHLDRVTYAGTENSLMTPVIANGEVQHLPGVIALAMFADMGWQIASSPVEVMESIYLPFVAR